MIQSEKELQNACLDYLAKISLEYPIFYMRNHVSGLFKFNRKTKELDAIPNQNSGISDLIIIYKGKAYYIELKFAKGKQTLKQKEFEKRVTNAGALYYVVWELDKFHQIIKNILN